MQLREVVLVALPFVVAIAIGVGFLYVIREHGAVREAARSRARLAEPDLATPLRDPRPAQRPWWGNPWLWVGVSAVCLVLGLYVWPGLFGGAFLFLPFVWVRRSQRGDDVDPRTNGHSTRDPGSLGG